jgi:hypothetical protein
VRGVHILALAALFLAALAVGSTERYTTRFQSLPVLDWIESRPPLAEATSVPSSAEMARGFARAMPLLVIAEDARPWLPVFGPPAYIQRSMGGVRDASRITLASPGSPDAIQVRLYAVVFNRTVRANEWTELMAREMDIRDPDSGLAQSRVTGPDEIDNVWVVAPRQTGGIATVVGHRGPIAFDLQVTLGPRPPIYAPESAHAPTPEVLDLSARAEVLAREAATNWSTWVEQQLGDKPPNTVADNATG